MGNTWVTHLNSNDGLLRGIVRDLHKGRSPPGQLPVTGQHEADDLSHATHLGTDEHLLAGQYGFCGVALLWGGVGEKGLVKGWRVGGVVGWWWE